MGAFRAKKNGVWGLLIGVVTVIALWLAWAIWGVGLMHRVALAGIGLAAVPAGAEPYATAGQIGDLFGGVNALFAALACVGVFWAGWLQRLQLEDARAAYAVERDANNRREDEAFFFNLLPIVKSLGDDITFQSPFLWIRNANIPRDADGIVQYALSDFLANSKSGGFVGPDEMFDAFEKSLLPVVKKNSASLAVFFRVAFQMFVWLDAQAAAQNPKTSAFADIARSHLSSGFATLLGLFALRESGAYFHDVVIRYGLLEHAIGGALTRQALLYKYPAAAFGSNAADQPSQPTAEEKKALPPSVHIPH